MVPALLTLLLLGTDGDVWSSSLSVGAGQAKVLHAKGLTPGAHYQLVTRGRCEHVDRGRVRRWRENVNPNPPEPFGVEYRVSVGSQSFSVDVAEQQTVFRAEEAAPEVRIEDRSASIHHAKCTLTFVAIRGLDAG
jgi:hypothetical protein